MDIEVRRSGSEFVFVLPYGVVQAPMYWEGPDMPKLVFTKTNSELPPGILGLCGTNDCPIEIRPMDGSPHVFLMRSQEDDLEKIEEWIVQLRGRGVQFETRILATKRVFKDIIREAFETVTAVDHIAKTVSGNALGEGVTRIAILAQTASGNQLKLDL